MLAVVYNNFHVKVYPVTKTAFSLSSTACRPYKLLLRKKRNGRTHQQTDGHLEERMKIKVKGENWE